MTYILHNFRRCPFCIRVRILLFLKGIEYKIVEEPFRIWTPWMKEWSAKADERLRVPVLRFQDESSEKVFVESNDINMMLDQKHEGTRYSPILGSPSYLKMEEWMNWCDNVFKHQIDRFKYGENRNFDQERHPENTKLLSEMLIKLETALHKKRYLIDDKLTLADIAIIPFVRQIMRTRSGEFDFSKFPYTKSWTLVMTESDWFANIVMKKYPVI